MTAWVGSLFPIWGLGALVCAAGAGLLFGHRKNERLNAALLSAEAAHRDSQRQLTELTAVVAQADAHKDQFLSILSHELRTPINVITGFGSILQDEMVGPLNDQQKDCMNKLLQAGDGLLNLVNAMLDMGRIQAGRFSISPGPVQVLEVVDGVLAGFVSRAEHKGLTLACELPHDLPVLIVDELRVTQALCHLLENAIKFTPEGGQIRVRLHAGVDSVVCEVEDTGEGIGEADMSRLFQRFSQLDMSATRCHGGAGLGLSITKALIEAHGGAVGVRSELAVGSCFWFSLPLRAARRVPAMVDPAGAWRS